MTKARVKATINWPAYESFYLKDTGQDTLLDHKPVWVEVGQDYMLDSEHRRIVHQSTIVALIPDRFITEIQYEE